jgi:hypothetical protein
MIFPEIFGTKRKIKRNIAKEKIFDKTLQVILFICGNALLAITAVMFIKIIFLSSLFARSAMYII